MSPARNNPAGYSGTPLPKKLGIKPGTTILLRRPPQGFLDLLEPLPEDTRFLRRRGPRADQIFLFVRHAKELADIEPLLPSLGDGGLWIFWPKKGSELESDVGGGQVREAGLAAGLVDIKVCAVDATWSGHRFARRRS